MVSKVLEQAHDAKHHFGANRMIQDLVTVKIDRLTHRVNEYLKACRTCAVNQTSRQPPIGNYQPTMRRAEPMHTLALDWIVSMPEVPLEGTP